MTDYRPIDQQLMDACRAYPPDFAQIKSLLSQGADVNAMSATDEDESLLSEVILGYPEVLDERTLYCESCEEENCDGCCINKPDADGRYLPLIVQFFLENGFDASGHNGALCLKSLTWSSYDRYILDACKLLMDAGADPNAAAFSDDGDTVISWVGTKISGSYVADDHPATGHLFSAMYQMMLIKLLGKNYHLIEHYDACVGKTLHGVSLCADDRPLAEIFSSAPLPEHCQSQFAPALVLDCDGKMLCIDRYGDMYVDPHIPQYARDQLDLSDRFRDYIGQAIASIDVDWPRIRQRAAQAGYPQDYPQPIVFIEFCNGRTLSFAIRRDKVPTEDMVAWFELPPPPP